jgi:diguanylate cyclase (GGDEF)-like protein
MVVVSASRVDVLHLQRFIKNQFQLINAKTNLASRVAWLSLSLSSLGAFLSILIATFWLSNLEISAKHEQLALDVDKFSALIQSSLVQYDFARLDDVGSVFTQENKLIKDLEIWHFDGLKMMHSGEPIQPMGGTQGSIKVYEHQISSSDGKNTLGTLRYTLVDFDHIGLSSTYWIATAIMIGISTLLTALIVQRLLKSYLVRPLTELTEHVQSFSIYKPQLDQFNGGARELKQLYSSFKFMADRVVNQATTDPITGLRNRIYLESCIEQASSAPDRSCAVLLLDLDHFKRINDNYGHPTGDFLLNAIAHRLSDLMQENIELVRMGGDEFAIWFHDSEGGVFAKKMEMQILKAMQQPFLLDNGRSTTVRLSGGFAAYPSNVSTPQNLLKAADLALYRTKELRSGDVTYYTENLSTESSEWLEMADLLRAQIESDSLTFYYQKINYPKDQAIWGYELLLRLISSTGRVYDTEAVMQVVASLGLNEQLLDKSIELVINTLSCNPGISALSVNMSPEQIVLLTPQKIENQLASISDDIRKRIVVEVTENSLLDYRDVLTPIKKLHQLGFRIALDDFGSGYSALNCLNSFPLSIVKLDKSLTGNVRKEKNRKLLSNITIISKSMGYDVIAEGIETDEQYYEVKRLGCDLMQGFKFGMPMTYETLCESLVANEVDKSQLK